MGYKVKLEVFEGPMDLLLHLIDQAEIDIYDIPISEITRQYIDYLFALEQLDLEIASSFLVMAATLLAIKVKMLLPKTEKAHDESEEEEDPRAALIRQLIAYRIYKKAASVLADEEKKQAGIVLCMTHFPFIEKDMTDNGLKGIHLKDLIKAYANALASFQAVEVPIDIPREIIPIRKKIEEILRTIFTTNKGINYNNLIANPHSKHEKIVTLLAILELARSKHIKVHQDTNFYEITIYRNTKEEH